jgi:hypothetical protein
MEWSKKQELFIFISWIIIGVYGATIEQASKNFFPFNIIFSIIIISVVVIVVIGIYIIEKVITMIPESKMV